MMRVFAVAILAVLLLFASAWGQTSADPHKPRASAGVRFEVASVRPVRNWPPPGGGAGQRGTGGGCPTSMKVDPARADFKCVNLAMLIGYAFRISPDRVTGPGWMMAGGSPRFDIAAIVPQGAAKNQVPEMFQAFLAERFKLVIHRATGELPIYALVAAKGGLKLKTASRNAVAPMPAEDANAAPSLDGFYGSVQSRTIPNADGGESVTTISSPRMGTVRAAGDPYRVQRWEASSISIAGLADLLDHVAPLDLPIIDMTGLKERYQLVLEVSLRDLPGTPIAEKEEAVLRGFNDGLLKLGLRLERRKGPVETIVVDRVEKSPTEN